MNVRRDMWSLLAARVNEKWQRVDQKVNDFFLSIYIFMCG